MERRLRILILWSVGVGAALAVLSLLGLDFAGQERIIGTSFSIAAAGALVTVALMAREQGRLAPVIPAAAALASVVAFGLIVGLIWGEPDPDWPWKLSGTFTIAALALSLICFLSLARLVGRFEWVRASAYVLSTVGAGFIAAFIWWEIGNEDEWIFRVFGVVMVLLASATVAVPVLHLASRPELRVEEGEAIGFCPFCGAVVDGATGVSIACRSCKARFRVEQLAAPQENIVLGRSSSSPST